MTLKYFSNSLNKFCIMMTLLIALLTVINSNVSAGEVVIGEEEVTGGIEFIFEGAPADTISPAFMHLREDETEVHLEVRANLVAENSFASAAGGFLPYLNVNVLVNNRVTGESLHITLMPHLNLIDGFHYARNVDLPGDPISDSYDMTYFIEPAGEFEVQIHSDFRTNVNDRILDGQRFTFENVNFADVFEGNRSGSGNGSGSGSGSGSGA